MTHQGPITASSETETKFESSGSIPNDLSLSNESSSEKETSKQGSETQGETYYGNSYDNTSQENALPSPVEKGDPYDGRKRKKPLDLRKEGRA